tara:strand:- start:217 stop:1218 length:1002 start_codon:yes stop_codon:yes gene_type:complete
MEIYKHKFIAFNGPTVDLTEKQLHAINRFNELIKNNSVHFEQVSCLCNCEIFDLIATVDCHGILQQTVMCKKCGLVLSNPRMTEISYRDFYKTDMCRLIYHSGDIEEYTADKINNPDTSFNDSQNIFKRVSKFKMINNSLDILEFGAASGYTFIKAEANVTGIDYCPKCVEIGDKYGVRMIKGGLEKIEGKYDLILLCHVLEHFLDPIGKLKKIKEHLSEDGLLYISVPNIMNFAMGQIQNGHTYYFNPENFKFYMNCAGLKMIDFGIAQKIHMYGIFKVENVTPDNKHLLLSKKKMSKQLSKAVYLCYLKLFLKKIGLLNVLRQCKIKFLGK